MVSSGHLVNFPRMARFKGGILVYGHHEGELGDYCMGNGWSWNLENEETGLQCVQSCHGEGEWDGEINALVEEGGGRTGLHSRISHATMT